MEKEKDYNWVHVEGFTLEEVKEDLPLDVQVGEKRLCMLRRGANIYATAAYCPHAGVPMCDGWVDKKGDIVCPKHKYKFDPSNGRNTSGEGYKLKTYPVEIIEGSIFVGFKQD